MVPLHLFLILSAVLFSIGIVLIIVKKNAILVLMGIELILNAANLNLVGFSQFDPKLDGHFFSLFIMIVAAAETAVALAIIINAYTFFKTINLDQIDTLKG